MAKVKPSDIVIKNERFRQDFGDVESLAVSIQRYGLFHPIIIQKSTMELVAGERRLKAHLMLNLPGTTWLILRANGGLLSMWTTPA